MKIGELAARTGVPQRMLRYYEEQGLVAPGRSDNGYRTYADEDVDRVNRVRSLIRAGLPTRLIKPVLEKDDPRVGWTGACTQDLANELADELAAIEERLSCLQHSRDSVRDFLDRTRAEASR